MYIYAKGTTRKCIYASTLPPLHILFATTIIADLYKKKKNG